MQPTTLLSFTGQSGAWRQGPMLPPVVINRMAPVVNRRPGGGIFGLGSADADTDTWGRLGWGRIATQMAASGGISYLASRYLFQDTPQAAILWAGIFASLQLAREYGARREHLR